MNCKSASDFTNKRRNGAGAEVESPKDHRDASNYLFCQSVADKARPKINCKPPPQALTLPKKKMKYFSQ
jgi:hypothetical protein